LKKKNTSLREEAFLKRPESCLPHVWIICHHFSAVLSWDSEHPVDDVDNAVDGADVLLVDGRVDAARRHRHSLLARTVVEPDAVVRQRRRGGIGLEDFKDDFCIKIRINFGLEIKCIYKQEF
jgi:hypothetical protein